MNLRTWIAERWRISVRLNIGEMNLLLKAAIDAGAGDRGEPDLTRAALRIQQARDRRMRAMA